MKPRPRQPAPALVLACALLAVGAARAQSALKVEPTPALGCVQVKEGAPAEPEYPFDQYKAGQPGRVTATVTLPGGLFGNRIEIVSSEGGPAFVEATRAYLRGLRAPCLKDGQSATLKYEFVFNRDQRQVHWARPSDAEAEDRRLFAKCVVHKTPGSVPEYDLAARLREAEGRVFGVLHFDSADAPPRVELLRRPSSAVFDAAIMRWAAGLRMPCHPGGEVITTQSYTFMLEGNGQFGFKPMTLLELLSAVKGVRDNGLQMDTREMGCPFQLKFSYYQPLRRNAVGEVGDSDPARRPLLEWLAGAELVLSDKMLDAVFADTAELTVPCVKINVKPKEKRS